MMLAILAAAVVSAAGPSPTPVAPVSVEAPAPAELSPAEQVRQLQMIYVQSCGDRAWGSFGDACNQMKRQIRDAEKAARKAENARK